jgi:hypothetical protein
MKEIIWKSNDMGGKNAYVGTIRIDQYFYNGVDSVNGKYKVSSLLPQSKVSAIKLNTDEEAQELISNEFKVFMEKLNG